MSTTNQYSRSGSVRTNSGGVYKFERQVAKEEHDWTPRKDRSGLVLLTGLAIVGLMIFVMMQLGMF